MKLPLRLASASMLALCAYTTSHSQTTAGPAASPAANVAQTAAVSPPAPLPPGTSLASIGDTKVTLADYEASLLNIPERDRYGWAMDQKRVSQQVDGLLKIRTIAEEARRKGLDKDPLFKLRVDQYAEKLLTEMVGAKADEAAAAEFEQKRSSFIDRAREQYLINKQQFQTQKEVKASHILIEARSRPADEALAKIKAIRVRAVSGESFETLAETTSDDRSAKQNKGELGFFGPGRMDPAFEAAAFALKQPMEISEPIKSAFGYHLIRLEEIKPARQLTFDEASPELMEKLKQQYVDQRRSQTVAALYDSSKVKWNEPAVVGLKKTVDPALFRLPEQLLSR